MATIWFWLADENNRAILLLFGGAIVALSTGVWAIFKFFASRRRRNREMPTVSASSGSIAAGRDIRDNKIDNRRNRAGDG